MKRKRAFQKGGKSPALRARSPLFLGEPKRIGIKKSVNAYLNPYYYAKSCLLQVKVRNNKLALNRVVRRFLLFQEDLLEEIKEGSKHDLKQYGEPFYRIFS